MTRFARLGRLLLFGSLLWGSFVPMVSAQQTRTLTIRDSAVYVDGRPLSPDQVPDDLALEGMARYQFVGIQQPVIELNGRLFAVEDGLRPVSEEEVHAGTSSVILQEIEARPPTPARTPDSRGPRVQSSESAVARSNRPRAAQQRYLSEVQKANRDLYKRLVRERIVEEQAQDLARVIRMLPNGSDERQGKADSLRALLNNIFDLKQENRRREIERLQREIQELQRSLQKRKRMREPMIDRRFDQLVGTPSER